MRLSVLLGLLLALALNLQVIREPDPLRADPKAAMVDKLIQQLGDDDFDKREEAERALAALGEPVLPLVRKAALEHPDLEIRRRAVHVMDTITPLTTKNKSLGMSFSRIDPGEFQMGSPANERNRRPDEQLHLVRIPRAYYIGTYEVTQEEFQKIQGTNLSWFHPQGGGQDSVRGQNTARYPAERVSWFDALDFCNLLSEKDGYEPFYRLTDIERVENSIQKATVQIRGGNGYRLPTEAEWEYACRAKTETPFWYGQETGANQANLKAIIVSIGYGSAPKFPELGRPTTVGSYPPNPWKLHDQHGNVGEWCWDWYDRDYYANSPRDNPQGPDRGTQRVVRGGSWLVTDPSSRSASRLGIAPSERYNTVGFRICRMP